MLSPLPCSVPFPVSLPVSVLSSREEPVACPPAPAPALVWLGQDRCSLQPPLTPPTDLTINSAPPPPAACLWGGKGEGRTAVCTLDPLPSHPHLSPTGPSWWEPPLWGHRLLCQRGLLCPHPHFDEAQRGAGGSHRGTELLLLPHQEPKDCAQSILGSISCSEDTSGPGCAGLRESDPEQRGPRRYRFTDGQSGWSPTSRGDSLCPMGSSHVEEERQCWDSSLPGMPVSPPLPPGGCGVRTLLRVMPTDIPSAKAESAVSTGKVGTTLTYDQCGLELPSIAPQGRA